MSVLNKKPFIETLLGQLSPAECATLLGLLNAGSSEYSTYDLDSLASVSSGVHGVKLIIDKLGTVYVGYYINKSTYKV